MTVWIFNLESVETRYTSQWKTGLPDALKQYSELHEIISIHGEMADQTTTPGAFLNFAGTNIYKSTQLTKFAYHVQNGDVKDGDHILFADAWNPTILNVKYMVELLGIDCTLHGMWHAGSYDPQDFLGRLIKDKMWSISAERSFFFALDHNYFATEYHINLFAVNVLGDLPTSYIESEKIIKSGQPHEKLVNTLSGGKKENLVLFPHRLAPEKQVDIFRKLATMLPQYEFVVCQDTPLTKHEYHDLLARAKVVFSANLQETLGISTAIEAPACMAIPMVPNRLSYTELFAETNFIYPSEWSVAYETADFESLANRLISYMENYSQFIPELVKYNKSMTVASGEEMYKRIMT